VLISEKGLYRFFGMNCRFPAPWSVRELAQAFVVQDASGQAVAYTYFRKDANQARQANVLEWDEARRIAANSSGDRSTLALAFFLAQARPRSCHPRRSFRRPIYEPGLIPPQ
jgi:hypothetical protein